MPDSDKDLTALENQPVVSTKKEVEDMSEAEFVEFIINTTKPSVTPSVKLKDLKKCYIETAKATGKERKKMDKTYHEKLISVMNSTLTVESGINAMQGIEEAQHCFAVRMCEELEKEYEARTYSEKMLVQTAVIAYCRMQEHIRYYRAYSNAEYLTPIKAKYLSAFGKEIDRCSRQYTTALQTLKNLKQPPLKVCVTAKTAFVAQNQQNNAPSMLTQNNDPQ